MILQLFLGLVTISLLFFMVRQERRRRVWSVFLFCAVLALLYAFFEQINAIGINNVIYSWIPHQTLQANISFSAGGSMAPCIRILGLCMVVLIYLNTLYRREEYSLYINNFLLLNFAVLLILLASQDFIQLMIGSSGFLIIGFYLINNTEARTKFIFYGFLAELALFTALAVVYANTGSVALTAIPSYLHEGRHRDLVSVLLLGVVLLKCGMFLFQNHLLTLKSLNFNRVLTLAVFSAPLSGMVIFAKLFPLIAAANFSHSIFCLIIGLSAVWAVVGGLLIDNLKAKVFYLAMLMHSFMLWTMWADPGIFFERLVYLYPPFLAVGLSVLFLSVSTSDGCCLSEMGGLGHRLWSNLILSLLAVFAFGAVTAHRVPFISGWIFLSVFLFITAALWHGAYLGRMNADDKVDALLRNVGFLYWGPYTAAVVFLIWQSGNVLDPLIWKIWAAYLAVFLLLPTQKLFMGARWEGLQSADVLGQIYQSCFVGPLRFIGRILWLAIDFVVIERSIIGSVSQSTAFVIGGLHRLQDEGKVGYLLMIGMGMVMILSALGWYCHG